MRVLRGARVGAGVGDVGTDLEGDAGDAGDEGDAGEAGDAEVAGAVPGD